MKPDTKRFDAHFRPLADAVAALDLDQHDRESVAVALADAIETEVPKATESRGTSQDTRTWLRGWRRDLFVLLASDPLVPCAGAKGEPCPHGRVIRIRMHNSTPEKPLPYGRSLAWRRRAPYGEIRCVSCGAREYVEDWNNGGLEVAHEEATS